MRLNLGASLGEPAPRTWCQHCHPLSGPALKPVNHHHLPQVEMGTKGVDVPQVPTNDCSLCGNLNPRQDHDVQWTQVSIQMDACSKAHSWSATTHDSRIAAPWLHGVVGAGQCPSSTNLPASPQISHCIVSFQSPNSIIQNAFKAWMTCSHCWVLVYQQHHQWCVRIQCSRLIPDPLNQNTGSQTHPRSAQSNLYRWGLRVSISTGYPVIPSKLSSYLWISLIFRLKSESNIQH